MRENDRLIVLEHTIGGVKMRVEIDTVDNYTIIGNDYADHFYTKFKHSVLLVHGAAKGKNPIPDYFIDAQEILNANKIHSLSVHLRGVGLEKLRSKGNYNDSLFDKTDDILAGIHYLLIHYPENRIHLIVSSMNAVTALLALGKVNCIENTIDSISLISPAAYPKGAELVPLGDEFSKIIRNPYKDLKSSPTFEIFERFNGKRLVAYGDSDKVIPREVQEAYKRSADIVYNARGTDHDLGVTPNSSEFKLLYNLIAQMLLST